MSIHDKAILISLTLAGIGSARADKAITSEVLRDHNAQADAGRWLARLWPKKALEPIRAIDARIRTFHYERSLPWSDRGERMIPARAYTAYIDHMRGLRREREQAVQDFIDHYDQWISEARVMRGDSFRSADYPTRYAAADRFRMEVAATPIPSAKDFRVELSSRDMEEIEDEIATRIQRATLDAQRALFERIAAPIAALCERLAQPDARISESTFNALRSVVDAIPDLNAFDDPLLDHLAAEIQAKLLRLNPDGLQSSRSDRAIALNSANAILNKMAPWLDDLPDENEDAA